MLQVIASVGALQAMGASSESCCVAGPHACNCSTPRPLTSCWKRNGVGDLSLSLYSTFPSSFSLLKRGRSAGGSTLAAPPRVPAIPHSGAPCSMRPSGEIRPRARALRVRRDSRCGLPASPWSPAAATASTLLAPRTRLRRGPVCLLRLAQTRDANRQVKCASGMQSGAQHAREPLSACPSAHAWCAMLRMPRNCVTGDDLLIACTRGSMGGATATHRTGLVLWPNSISLTSSKKSGMS